MASRGATLIQKSGITLDEVYKCHKIFYKKKNEENCINCILAFTCDICEKVEKFWVVYEKTHEDSY